MTTDIKHDDTECVYIYDLPTCSNITRKSECYVYARAAGLYSYKFIIIYTRLVVIGNDIIVAVF